MRSRILIFALDDLRLRYGAHLAEGADPRHDTTPFRAFRAALLEEAARTALESAEISFWWEGTYNGYALALAVSPPRAFSEEFDPENVCDLETERVASPRPHRYPLARVAPGSAETVRDQLGATFEVPFGSSTGHFGAPGVKRVR